jgi:flagellar basal-body rod protein FlgC
MNKEQSAFSQGKWRFFIHTIFILTSHCFYCLFRCGLLLCIQQGAHHMSFWQALRIGSSGLTAQRLRLDLISNNIANAQTTRTEKGGPYQRQDVVFMPEGKNTSVPQSVAARRGELSTIQGGVRVAQITTDTEAGPRVYDPTNPDADANGYVNYPNVDIVVEMTNMLSATRSYEANLASVEAVKRMALKALEIGK